MCPFVRNQLFSEKRIRDKEQREKMELLDFNINSKFVIMCHKFTSPVSRATFFFTHSFIHSLTLHLFIPGQQ